MYNRFLEYLKKIEPEKTISKGGIKIRKRFNPLVKAFAPFMSKYKMKVIRSKKETNDKPIIFSATHGFRDDILFTMRAIKTHGYILFGNIQQLYHSYEGKGEVINRLRDTFATLKWEIWEGLSVEHRQDIPDEYWEKEIARRLREYRKLDYEYEMSCIREER